MTPERIDLRDIAPQPWKNGAGFTREIAFGGASASSFDWRISLAEVARDAPFSAFPGVDRCIVLWQGDGMRLRSADGTVDHLLTTPLAPFVFPGDIALDATLVAGRREAQSDAPGASTSSDFNVMTRRGAFRSEVRCERHAAELPAVDVTLLLCHGGQWQVGAEASSSTLGPMQALLWREPAGVLRVQPLGGDAALLVVRLSQHRRP